jgi:hypothetical protein
MRCAQSGPTAATATVGAHSRTRAPGNCSLLSRGPLRTGARTPKSDANVRVHSESSDSAITNSSSSNPHYQKKLRARRPVLSV